MTTVTREIQASFAETRRLKAEAQARKYARIRQLIADGNSDKEIADATGYTTGLVWKVRRMA